MCIRDRGGAETLGRDAGEAGRYGEAPSELTVPVARASAHRAIRAWDSVRLVRVLREAAVRLPLETFLEYVLVDVLRQIGHAWQSGELTPAREHMVSAIIPGVLAWIEDRLPEPAADAPLAVFATPAGTRHDIGARLAELVAREAGWRTLFLGPDLPAGEIVRAARENGAALIGISLVYAPDDVAVAAELERLVRERGEAVLIVGGAAAPAYADVLDAPRVAVTASLADVRRRLGDAA